MLFSINAIITFSQTITIVDKSTYLPIETVILTSENPAASASTNLKGEVDITNFKSAESISVEALGYKSVIVTYIDLIVLTSFQLESQNLKLDEVIVSATRWRQNSGNVPQKVTSISRKDIALQNPQTAADLLSVSGKVYVQKSQQGGGSPMIRGFATNRLLYSVDGVRINTAIFRAGNIQNVINLDPFSIQNTEVFFGPGSVMYGSDAIGGVMSFQTITPDFSIDGKKLVKGNVAGRFSSANKEKTGHADMSFGWKKFALTTSASYWDFDNLRQGKNGPSEYLKNYYVQRINTDVQEEDVVIIQEDSLLQIPSGYTQLNLMQKVRFAPNDKWDFQYGFHYSETSDYGRYDRHLRKRNGTARYGEWSYGPQKWMMNNLSITNKGSGKLYDQMSIRLAQQKFDESRIDRNLNNVNRNTQSEEVLAYSINADFLKVKGKSSWNYGVEYVLNDVTSTGLLTDISDNISEEGPSRYPQAKWQTMAAFINNNYKFSNKANLQAGLRYTQITLDAEFTTKFLPLPFTEANINNGALTGSLGLVYRPSPSWVLSSNLGTAFRSPNVDDLGKTFDSAPGTLTIPNADLKSEYAYSFDLGIAKVINDKIKIDLSAYYTILENALVRRNFSLNGSDSIEYDGETVRVQAIQNAAVANVYGIQAGIEIMLMKHLSLSSDYNIQIGEEELDDASTSPSRHAAPAFGTTRLNFSKKKLTLQVNAQYQAEKSFADLPEEEKAKTEIYAVDVNGDPFAPSWVTLNFKGMYNISKNLSATAGVENITDERYRPYSSGISAAGLNFVVGLNARF